MPPPWRWRSFTTTSVGGTVDEQSRKQIERTLADSDQVSEPDREGPVEPEIPSDRRRNFRSPNFSRMRTTWRGEDKIVIEEIRVQAGKVLNAMFGDAFGIMERLHRLVREPQVNPSDGTLRLDPDGRPVWRVHDNGMPVEDWSNLGDRERLQFLYEITTHLFTWEQLAAELWGEAMLAKVAWEERFADGFTGVVKGTVDDKVQAGTVHSLDERYFAVFQAILSRKADALVRSMSRLEQRLKDTTQL